MNDGVVVPFVGLQERTARQNLDAYIERAKSQQFFRGPNALDWDAVVWDLRPFANTRGQNPAGYVVRFTVLEAAKLGSRVSAAYALPEPFLSAAKAIIVDFLDRTSMAHPTKLVTCLRTIERTFRDLEQKADLCSLTHEILDQASNILFEKLADAWSYGRAMERLVHETINPGYLTTSHLLWRSPFVWRGAKRTNKVSTASGEVERSDKLPHLKCIIDIASVFQTATVPTDIVTTGWMALAMFSPNRINEILTIPVNCETEMDGVYGLSWRPLKGGDPMTKFATGDEWAEVAREAIRRLRELGATSRRAAAWYAENPGQLYLPPGFEHLRDQPVTNLEICGIIGRKPPFKQTPKMDRFLRATGMFTKESARIGVGSRAKLYEFNSIQDYVISLLPRDFPIADKRSGLMAADALFCLPLHIMRTDGETLQHVPDLISKEQISHDIGSKPGGTTIFFRHGLLDPSTGKPWKLQSHQPRHLLNTLAQSKHLSEALIAFWSGRKRVDQNAWYNHIPHEAFIEAYVTMGVNAPRQVTAVGPLADKIKERARLEMVTHDAALRLEVGSIISTRFGLCRHNYALTPCPKDKNCIACGENTFIKGDQRQTEEARKQLAISQTAVANCHKAIADGEPGVERWLAKHEEAASRWELASQLLTDPSLTDGTLITLPAPKVSQTRTGLAHAIRGAELSNLAVGPSQDPDDSLALWANI